MEGEGGREKTERGKRGTVRLRQADIQMLCTYLRTDLCSAHQLEILSSHCSGVILCCSRTLQNATISRHPYTERCKCSPLWKELLFRQTAKSVNVPVVITKLSLNLHRRDSTHYTSSNTTHTKDIQRMKRGEQLFLEGSRYLPTKWHPSPTRNKTKRCDTHDVICEMQVMDRCRV